MWPVVGAAIVGALWARRGVAQTRILKSQVVGARSGREWRTEFFPDLGTMMVFGSSARVAFQRTEEGWKAERASGNPNEVAIIRKDFET